jgi:adenylate kinase family enzyme
MINVIAGAPGSGKSTYVKNKAKKYDIVIDLDKIAESFTYNDESGHMQSAEIRSVAIAARTGAVKRAIAIHQAKPDLNIWIVNADPSKEDLEGYRFLKAKIVTLNPGKEVCLERIKGKRPESFTKLIDAWFMKWSHE